MLVCHGGIQDDIIAFDEWIGIQAAKNSTSRTRIGRKTAHRLVGDDVVIDDFRGTIGYRDSSAHGGGVLVDKIFSDAGSGISFALGPFFNLFQNTRLQPILIHF